MIDNTKNLVSKCRIMPFYIIKYIDVPWQSIWNFWKAPTQNECLRTPHLDLLYMCVIKNPFPHRIQS